MLPFHKVSKLRNIQKEIKKKETLHILAEGHKFYIPLVQTELYSL